MIVLGINWDHPSGASILHNDTVVGSVSEERYSGLKNDIAFPKESISYCQSLIDNHKEITAVGVASLDVSYGGMLYHYATMPIADHIREQHEIWFPRLYEGKVIDDVLIFKDRWITEQYPKYYWREYNPSKKLSYSEDSLQIIAEFLSIDKSKVYRVEHHWCHAYYGYFSSPFQNEPALIITIDGFGDGLNATISIADNGSIKRIYQTDKCILGRVYRHLTLLLGMKPLEHEYKVMGLAPYVSKNDKDSKKVLNILSDIIEVNGININIKNKPTDMYFYFRDKFEGIRFDKIAAGLQWWIEDTLSTWVNNIVSETEVGNVVISGGVAMNVKAMGKIGRNLNVKQLFVPGSAGDDSNCIGAAIGAQIKNNDGKFKNNRKIISLYLGHQVQSDEVNEVIKSASQDEKLLLFKEPSDHFIASLLAKGLIIGRCFDRMEFGQRALGNRSILADPVKLDMVVKINGAIKSRDFWMPFAPVILDKYVDKYLINDRKIESAYMTIAFDTTEEGFKNLRAACHPADKTARAQILRKDHNPALYSLLEAFERITGRGGLLNTSFNLHGFPIVRTAKKAYEILLKTQIDCLLLPNIMIIKKASLKDINMDCIVENNIVNHCEDHKIIVKNDYHISINQDWWERAAEYQEEFEHPLHVDIELTNICNLKCIMCETMKMKRKKGMMSFDTFKKIIEECNVIGVKTAKINLWGESLLHKSISEFIKYAKDNSSLILQFNTNATVLNKEIAERLISAGLDKITISLDGISKETYEKVRIGANYDVVLENVNQLINLKDGVKSEYPLITLQILKMTENTREVNDFVSYWRDKVDAISVTNIGSTMGDQDILSLSVREEKKKGRKPCPQIWQRLSVLWDGTVTVCCNDFEGLLFIGKIGKDKLKDLWKCDKLCHMRLRHKELNFDGLICDNCTETYKYY